MSTGRGTRLCRQEWQKVGHHNLPPPHFLLERNEIICFIRGHKTPTASIWASIKWQDFMPKYLIIAHNCFRRCFKFTCFFFCHKTNVVTWIWNFSKKYHTASILFWVKLHFAGLSYPSTLLVCAKKSRKCKPMRPGCRMLHVHWRLQYQVCHYVTIIWNEQRIALVSFIQLCNENKKMSLKRGSLCPDHTFSLYFVDFSMTSAPLGHLFLLCYGHYLSSVMDSDTTITLLQVYRPTLHSLFFFLFISSCLRKKGMANMWYNPKLDNFHCFCWMSRWNCHHS